MGKKNLTGDWDAIIVGGGVAGLSIGALLTNAGKNRDSNVEVRLPSIFLYEFFSRLNIISHQH